MAFCNAHGIPHSEFLNWPEDDQDLALGFEREKARVCSSCGTHQEEWEHDRWAYVSWERVCPGCEIKEQHQEDIPSGRKGVKVFLIKREFAEQQQLELDLDF